MENNAAVNYADIPAEQFEFADQSNISHDKKLETKPVGYFKGAFKRFCKNKGAIVAAIIIIILILFALFVPLFTPYTVSYYDVVYSTALPRCSWFENTSFWDGCEEKTVGKVSFIQDYAKGLETGHYAIKNNEYTVNNGSYTYRQDSIHYQAFGRYKVISADEYENIQKYQDETGIQVIYPTVAYSARPASTQDKENANIYYKTKVVKGITQPVLSNEKDPTSIITNYWTYKKGELDDGYHSKRIEGADGFKDKQGNTCYYAYSRKVSGGFEVRMNYYDYYVYRHTYVLQDGIKEPSFLLGCDTNGKDILTCLASGARFSFIFAIAVAVVNMIVGALYGAIEGYYGGKTDLIMERVSDILAAVPMMIVITLLKLHMGGSSHILVLFLSFFLTGWIGMASTTRMQFYRYKNHEYVLAARTLGAKDRRLMFKHIFPNAIGTLVTSFALVIPSMIFSEAQLTYLGIINLESGSITSVGTLIANGQTCLQSFPHVALFPSIFLALLMLSFNLFGNGLRDAFNPQLRGTEG